jgi:hypothetical protein
MLIPESSTGHPHQRVLSATPPHYDLFHKDSYQKLIRTLIAEPECSVPLIKMAAIEHDSVYLSKYYAHIISRPSKRTFSERFPHKNCLCIYCVQFLTVFTVPCNLVPSSKLKALNP